MGTNFDFAKFRNLTILYLNWLIRVVKGKWTFYINFLYNFFKIAEIKFFFSFLTHNYHARQFNPIFVKQNLRLLTRAVKEGFWVNSTKEGRLFVLDTKAKKRFFHLKNLLLFGALQKRVEKVIFYTFVTVSLEFTNPFDKKTLFFFLRKKIAFFNNLLKNIRKINGKVWNQSEIKVHIQVYERSSLLQARIIHSMEIALRRQKEPEIVKEAKEALKRGLHPILVSKGISGSYWLRGIDKQILGLFKPFDEEIHAPNNPIGHRFQGAMGLRKTRYGCRVGESAHHEVAAYLVDEFLGFGIVPRTYYASFTHTAFFLTREDRFSFWRKEKTKIGSFQEYIEGFTSINKLSAEEVASIPLDEYQLLVLLDMIIGNTDRNIGNVLFGDEKIAAIDHGLCFPDGVDRLSLWYWNVLELGKIPLMEPFVHLLNHFPLEKLSLLLRKQCFISVGSLHRMRERIALFTEGVNAGLVPKRLKGLLTPEYLFPLKELSSTLREKASEQVKLFMEKEKENEDQEESE